MPRTPNTLVHAEFSQCAATPWMGRYARIPGETAVFHVSSRGEIFVYWTRDDMRGVCSALASPVSRSLATAVMDGKRVLGGSSGGSFQINEFGQVLVPSALGNAKRVLVGVLRGPTLFRNPYEDDGTFTLEDDDGLSAGDPWDLPYVGMPFQLSGRNQIYCRCSSEDSQLIVHPEHQDARLIRALRAVRPTGGARFIVNPHGIVLTKRLQRRRVTRTQTMFDGSNNPFATGTVSSQRPAHSFIEQWDPVYVGRIDESRWFERDM